MRWGAWFACYKVRRMDASFINITFIKNTAATLGLGYNASIYLKDYKL
jgi:hypothetical protein